MATGSAATTTVGHVGLNVTNLERSRSFYRDVLGFEVVQESTAAGRAFAFLSRAPMLLTLWEQSDEPFPHHRAGLHHLAFEVESIEAVEAAERRLRALGATIHHGGIVAHAEGASSGGIYFEDPDGIRLEIYAPGGAADRPAPHGAAPACGFF